MWTLINNGKLANQIVRLVAIVVKSALVNGKPCTHIPWEWGRFLQMQTAAFAMVIIFFFYNIDASIGEGAPLGNLRWGLGIIFLSFYIIMVSVRVQHAILLSRYG